MQQDFFFVAAGVAVLLVALGLLLVFRRLNRALRAMEGLLLTANEELRETLPEVRGSVGNVNDITAAVNLGVHAAEQGVERSGRSLRSAVHGVSVGARSFFASSRYQANGAAAVPPRSLSPAQDMGRRTETQEQGAIHGQGK